MERGVSWLCSVAQNNLSVDVADMPAPKLFADEKKNSWTRQYHDHGQHLCFSSQKPNWH